MTTGRNEPCPCGSGKKHKHCCWSRGSGPPGENGSNGGAGGSGDSTSNLFGELRAEILRQAAARPPGSIAELQRSVVNPVVDRHNHTGQLELGGLSPNQVRRLMAADWTGADGALVVRRDLPLEEADQARVLRNARRLLATLAVEDGTRRRPRATSTGRSSRA